MVGWTSTQLFKKKLSFLSERKKCEVIKTKKSNAAISGAKIFEMGTFGKKLTHIVNNNILSQGRKLNLKTWRKKFLRQTDC